MRRRLPLVAHSVSQCDAARCPELGVDQKRHGHGQTVANEPELTKLESCSLSAIKGNGRMFV